MGVTIKGKGDFKKLDEFLKKSIEITKFENITPIAEACIRNLKMATPKDSGLTASSWGYEIKTTKNARKLTIYNSNVVDGVNIAFVIDVGHLTTSGYWISGKQYIQPNIIEALNTILRNTWKELNRL